MTIIRLLFLDFMFRELFDTFKLNVFQKWGREFYACEKLVYLWCGCCIVLRTCRPTYAQIIAEVEKFV